MQNLFVVHPFIDHDNDDHAVFKHPYVREKYDMYPIVFCSHVILLSYFDNIVTDTSGIRTEALGKIETIII